MEVGQNQYMKGGNMNAKKIILEILKLDKKLQLLLLVGLILFAFTSYKAAGVLKDKLIQKTAVGIEKAQNNFQAGMDKAYQDKYGVNS